MPGTRCLDSIEERNVVNAARRSSTDARLLVCLQLYAGYRLLEALRLHIGDVWRDGQTVACLPRPPHPLDQHRTQPLAIPVSRELERAITAHVHRREQDGSAAAEALLFAGLTCSPDGAPRPIERQTGLRIVRRVMARAGVFDDGRLGTHVLRKTFARKVFVRSGRNLMQLRDALGHASVSSTDEYIESLREHVEAAIRRGDWTDTGQGTGSQSS